MQGVTRRFGERSRFATLAVVALLSGGGLITAWSTIKGAFCDHAETVCYGPDPAPASGSKFTIELARIGGDESGQFRAVLRKSFESLGFNVLLSPREMSPLDTDNSIRSKQRARTELSRTHADVLVLARLLSAGDPQARIALLGLPREDGATGLHEVTVLEPLQHLELPYSSRADQSYIGALAAMAVAVRMTSLIERDGSYVANQLAPLVAAVTTAIQTERFRNFSPTDRAEIHAILAGAERLVGAQRSDVAMLKDSKYHYDIVRSTICPEGVSGCSEQAAIKSVEATIRGAQVVTLLALRGWQDRELRELLATLNVTRNELAEARQISPAEAARLSFELLYRVVEAQLAIADRSNERQSLVSTAVQQLDEATTALDAGVGNLSPLILSRSRALVGQLTLELSEATGEDDALIRKSVAQFERALKQVDAKSDPLVALEIDTKLQQARLSLFRGGAADGREIEKVRDHLREIERKLPSGSSPPVLRGNVLSALGRADRQVGRVLGWGTRESEQQARRGAVVSMLTSALNLQDNRDTLAAATTKLLLSEMYADSADTEKALSVLGEVTSIPLSRVRGLVEVRKGNALIASFVLGQQSIPRGIGCEALEHFLFGSDVAARVKDQRCQTQASWGIAQVCGPLESQCDWNCALFTTEGCLDAEHAALADKFRDMKRSELRDKPECKRASLRK